MKDYLKVAGQIAIGVIAGNALSKAVDKVVVGVKKVVKEKKEKSLN